MKTKTDATHIFFRNLVVVASIGIHEVEKKHRQRILLNIKIFLNPIQEIKDDLISETLDYDLVRGNILDIASSQHFNLQETLCEEIARYCFTEKRVTGVEISSEKPDIYDNCDGVGLAIVRYK